MRDIHLIELAKQLKLDLKTQIHLLYSIEEFVRDREGEKDPWQFRIKEDGTRYWINHIEMIVNFTYPHLESLGQKIRRQAESYDLKAIEPHLKDFSPLQLLAGSPIFLDKIQDCKKSTIRLMEEYFKLQCENTHQEMNLRNRLIKIKEQLQQFVTLQMDMYDFTNLIFFCDFDFEKYLQDKMGLEKKDMAFMKSMNPNGELNDKIEQIRIKEKKKLARLRSLNSSKKDFSLASDHRARRSEFLPFGGRSEAVKPEKEFDALGPVEDYLHLIDPELRKGDQPVVFDKARQILHDLNEVDEMTSVIEACQALLGADAKELNEEYLEQLLGDVKRLFASIEKYSSGQSVGSRSAGDQLLECARQDSHEYTQQEKTARGNQEEKRTGGARSDPHRPRRSP